MLHVESNGVVENGLTHSVELSSDEVGTFTPELPAMVFPYYECLFFRLEFSFQSMQNSLFDTVVYVGHSLFVMHEGHYLEHYE